MDSKIHAPSVLVVSVTERESLKTEQHAYWNDLRAKQINIITQELEQIWVLWSLKQFENLDLFSFRSQQPSYKWYVFKSPFFVIASLVNRGLSEKIVEKFSKKLDLIYDEKETTDVVK